MCAFMHAWNHTLTFTCVCIGRSVAPPAQFHFHSVLPGHATQADVYAAAAAAPVASFLNGGNATIFCYGQTGSGKTHTLSGQDAEAATRLSALTPRSGVLPRALAATTARMHRTIAQDRPDLSAA